MAGDVWAWCEKAQAFGRTVTVKIKYADQQITRSRSRAGQVATHDELVTTSLDLVRSILPTPKGVRLVGGDGVEF